MDESIDLVEFSKHSERVWSKPFDYAHIEVGLKIWNPHRSTAGAAFLDVQFDDLARDPVRVVSDVYAFLGAQPHETNPHLLVKSIQRPLDEVIANYAEVEAALVGTPWEVPARRRVVF